MEEVGGRGRERVGVGDWDTKTKVTGKEGRRKDGRERQRQSDRNLRKYTLTLIPFLTNTSEIPTG